VVKKEDGQLEVKCASQEQVKNENFAWGRGGYSEITANNLMKTLKEFSQKQLEDFVKGMNQPAEIITIKGKTP
jgi:hypothetical protein